MNLTNGIALVATDATGNMAKGVPAAIIGQALLEIGENASAAGLFQARTFCVLLASHFQRIFRHPAILGLKKATGAPTSRTILTGLVLSLNISPQ